MTPEQYTLVHEILQTVHAVTTSDIKEDLENIVNSLAEAKKAAIQAQADKAAAVQIIKQQRDEKTIFDKESADKQRLLDQLSSTLNQRQTELDAAQQKFTASSSGTADVQKKRDIELTSREQAVATAAADIAKRLKALESGEADYQRRMNILTAPKVA
jgi:hypothetical protein